MAASNQVVFARNEVELKQSILDLCAYTVQRAGKDLSQYAFHINMALRRQIALDNEDWQKISQSLNDNAIILDSNIGPIHENIVAFAQSLVDEADKAESDPYLLKLIKRSYLLQLDIAKSRTEAAIAKLAPLEQQANSASATAPYLKALRAHREYLDALISLPFILERAIVSAQLNTHVNYEYRKNAQALTALLNLANNAVNQGQPNITEKTIRLALELTMPKLPVGSKVLDTLTQDIIPVLNKILKASRDLEASTQDIFNPADSDIKKKSRKDLMEALGFKFSTLQDVLEDTLLHPARECANLGAGLQELASIDYKKAFEETAENVAACVNGVTDLLDNVTKLANLPTDLQSVPGWIQSAQSIYTGFRNLLPSGATTSDHDKIFAFIWFYDLVTKGNIDPALQKTLFESLQEGQKIVGGTDFNEYSTFSDTLAHLRINLEGTLSAQLAKETDNSILTDCLVYHRYERLHARLEALFDAPEEGARDSSAIFHEIAESLRAPQFKDSATIQTYIRSMVQTYQEMQLLPLLDTMQLQDNLGSITPAELKNIYTKLTQGQMLTHDDCLILKPVVLAHSRALYDELCEVQAVLDNYTLQGSQPQPGEAATPEKPVALSPRKRLQQQQIAIIKTSLVAMKMVVSQTTKSIVEQKQTCRALLNLLEENTPTYHLVDAKLAYITAVETFLTAQEASLENPDVLASEFHRWLQQRHDPLKDAPDLREMTKFLAQYAWERTQDNTPELKQFLRFCLRDTSLGPILQAKRDYEAAARNNDASELLPMLSDPLSVVNILPRQEEIMDALVDEVMGKEVGGRSLSTWALDFASGAASTIGSYITPGRVAKKLVQFIPGSPIIETLCDVVSSEPVQAAIQKAVGPVVDKYKAAAVDKAKDFARAVRGKIYTVLGAEVKAELVRNALKYAQNPLTETDPKYQDAFATFYLQYRALRARGKHKTDPRPYINFLFADRVDENDKRSISAIFTQLDAALNEDAIAAQTASQLHFLFSRLHLTQDVPLKLILCALINRSMLMELSNIEQAFADEKQREDASQTFNRLIFEVTGLLKNQTVLQNHPQFVKTVQPAVDHTQKVGIAQLHARLKTLDDKLKRHSDYLTEQGPRHGKRGWRDALNRVSFEPKRLLLSALYHLWEFISCISLLKSFVMLLPLLHHSATVSKFALGFLGFLHLGPLAIAALVVVAVVRIGVQIVVDLYARRDEVKEAKGLSKVALVAWITMLAIAKTVLWGYVFSKVIKIPAVIKRMFRGLHSYPAEATSNSEKAAIDALRGALNTYQKTKDYGPAAMKILKDQFDDTVRILNTPDGRMVLRDPIHKGNKTYREALDSYTAQFDEIQDLHSLLQQLSTNAATQDAGSGVAGPVTPEPVASAVQIAMQAATGSLTPNPGKQPMQAAPGQAEATAALALVRGAVFKPPSALKVDLDGFLRDKATPTAAGSSTAAAAGKVFVNGGLNMLGLFAARLRPAAAAAGKVVHAGGALAAVVVGAGAGAAAAAP